MSTPEGVKIGVISDTHNFFDPKIPGLFNGVEHILHAGDIGLPRILLDLEAIAPVTAVSGNTDDPGFGHTHKPFYQTIDGVIFFNPGYTGKSRFGMERTLAILYCDEKGIRPEFLRL